MKFGCQSMVAQMRRLLVKHPRNAFLSAGNIRAQWKTLNYSGCPNYEKALTEYDHFIALLRTGGTEILYLPQHGRTGLDSIYVHDPVLIANQGAILCNMGKAQRQHEPAAVGKFLSEIGVPVFGTIRGKGTLEGGDVLWLDDRTLAVGRGYRSNDEGIRQLQRLLAGAVDEFFVVPLPHWQGPNYVLHLMSLISLLDHNLALVYPRLLPVPFFEWLLARGIKLLAVPDAEFKTMAGNVLALAPRRCIMLSGNPQTQSLLEAEGVKVWVYAGEEISLKGAGGPTCLTRPILRV